MLQYTAELVCEAKARLAEGPVWFDNSLWFVDIEGRRLHRLANGEGPLETLQLDERIGFAVPAGGGRFVAGLQSGLYTIDWPNGPVSLLLGIEAGLPDNRFNDAKTDAYGRLVAGTMSVKGVAGAGSLYRVAPDLVTRILLEGVTISNGLGWSLEGHEMYYIDTPTRQVRAFPYGRGDEPLGPARVVAEAPSDWGFPDGLCTDAEGHLWVAFWGGSMVRRLHSQTGEVLATVQVPARKVTSCCFGGEGDRQLFITTAGGMSPEDVSINPHAGGIFRCQPEVGGLPVTRCQILSRRTA